MSRRNGRRPQEDNVSVASWAGSTSTAHFRSAVMNPIGPSRPQQKQSQGNRKPQSPAQRPSLRPLAAHDDGESYAGSVAGFSIRDIPMNDLRSVAGTFRARDPSIYGGCEDQAPDDDFRKADEERELLSLSPDVRRMFLEELLGKSRKHPGRRDQPENRTRSFEEGDWALVQDPQFSNFLKNMDHFDSSTHDKFEKWVYDLYEQFGGDCRKFHSDKFFVDSEVVKRIQVLPAYQQYYKGSFPELFSKINKSLDVNPSTISLKLGLSIHNSDLKTHTWDEFASMASCTFSHLPRSTARLPTVREVREELWRINKRAERQQQQKEAGEEVQLQEVDEKPPAEINLKELKRGLPELRNSEAWVPVFIDESLDVSKRDWIQVGNEAFLGQTFTEKEGRYPDWGDLNTADSRKKYYAVMNGLVVTEDLPERSLYHPANANKVFVCADIKSANYTVLWLCDPEIVLNKDSWEELLSTPDFIPERVQKTAFFECKSLRVQCLGKLAHDKGRRIQAYLLNLLYLTIINDKSGRYEWPKNIFRFSLDEMFFETTEDGWQILIDELQALMKKHLPKLAPFIKLGAFRLMAFSKKSIMQYKRKDAVEYASMVRGPSLTAASTLNQRVFASDLPEWDVDDEPDEKEAKSVDAQGSASDGGTAVASDVNQDAFEEPADVEWQLVDPPQDEQSSTSPTEALQPLPREIFNLPPPYMGKLIETSVDFIEGQSGDCSTPSSARSTPLPPATPDSTEGSPSEVKVWELSVDPPPPKYRVVDEYIDGGQYVHIESTQFSYLKLFADKDKIDLKEVPRHEKFSVIDNLVLSQLVAELKARGSVRGQRSESTGDVLRSDRFSQPSDHLSDVSWDYVRNSESRASAQLRDLPEPDIDRMSELLCTFDSVSLSINMSHATDQVFAEYMRRTGSRLPGQLKMSYIPMDGPRGPPGAISAHLRLIQHKFPAERAKACYNIAQIIQRSPDRSAWLAHYSQRVGAFRLAAEFFRVAKAPSMRIAATDLLCELCFWNARCRHELRDMGMIPDILEVIGDPRAEYKFAASCMWLLSAACIRNEQNVAEIVRLNGVSDILSYTLQRYINEPSFPAACRLLANLCSFPKGRRAVSQEHECLKYSQGGTVKKENGVQWFLKILKIQDLEHHAKDALLIAIAKFCADEDTCQLVVEGGGIKLLTSFMGLEPKTLSAEELEKYKSKGQRRRQSQSQHSSQSLSPLVPAPSFQSSPAEGYAEPPMHDAWGPPPEPPMHDAWGPPPEPQQQAPSPAPWAPPPLPDEEHSPPPPTTWNLPLFPSQVSEGNSTGAKSRNSSSATAAQQVHDSWGDALDPSELTQTPLLNFYTTGKRSETPTSMDSSSQHSAKTGASGSSRSFLRPVLTAGGGGKSSQGSPSPSPSTQSPRTNGGGFRDRPPRGGSGSGGSSSGRAPERRNGGGLQDETRSLQSATQSEKRYQMLLKDPTVFSAAPTMHWATLALVQISEKRKYYDHLDDAQVPGYLCEAMNDPTMQPRVCIAAGRALSILQRSSVSCDDCGTSYDVQCILVDRFRSGSRGYAVYWDFVNLCSRCSTPPEESECQKCKDSRPLKFMLRKMKKIGRREVGAHGSDFGSVTRHYYFCSEQCSEEYDEDLRKLRSEAE